VSELDLETVRFLLARKVEDNAVPKLIDLLEEIVVEHVELCKKRVISEETLREIVKQAMSVGEKIVITKLLAIKRSAITKETSVGIETPIPWHFLSHT